MRHITDGCSLLLGCWNAFFKNMLFKHGSPSESQMAVSPTGNIRSFCSEDALGWLIQTSKKKKKLWWGFFLFFFLFFFPPSSDARAKHPMSRGGFLVGSPHWKPLTRREASVMFYWLASFLEFGDNQAAEYFIGSSCLDRKLFASVAGVPADTSHRRHKQSYYMSETRLAGLGAERTGVVLWQNRVETQTVMFHCSLGERRLFVLNVTAELWGLAGAAGCWFFSLALVLLVVDGEV